MVNPTAMANVPVSTACGLRDPKKKAGPVPCLRTPHLVPIDPRRLARFLPHCRGGCDAFGLFLPRLGPHVPDYGSPAIVLSRGKINVMKVISVVTILDVQCTNLRNMTV
jgi:hypothetical protein